jgi:hypothetical protein
MKHGIQLKLQLQMLVVAPKLPTVCRNKTQREAIVSINILDYHG